MIEFKINPKNIKEELYNSLNYSYKGWGSRQHFDWFFFSNIGGMKPDILVGWEDGMIVTGTGIFYRDVELWNGNKMIVAILGSGFTIPGYRGKGNITDLIKKSIQIVGERDVGLLTSYVILSNPSYRTMVANNAEFFPTNYFVIHKGFASVTNKYSNLHKINNIEKDILIHMIGSDISKRTHFSYSLDQFKYQFLSRPSNIELFSYKNGEGYVILEKKDDQNRILLMQLKDNESFKECITELISLSKFEGKGLFHFTTLPEEIEICRKIGFKEISGVLPTFISNEEIFKSAFDYNGRFKGSLYNKDNICFIGDWDIKNGDRV